MVTSNRKPWRFLVGALVIWLLCLVPAARAEGQRVYDYAGLLAAQEVTELESYIALLSQDSGMDFVVLTIDNAEGKSAMAYADDFYDYNPFGFDEEYSGMLFLIDMDNREVYVSTTGHMQDVIDDGRLNALLDLAYDEVVAQDYYGAAHGVLAAAGEYTAAGVREGQYRYDSATGERTSGYHKTLTGGELALAVGAGLIVAAVLFFFIRSRYKLSGSTYYYDYINRSAVTITERRDQYRNTTTIKTPKPKASSSGRGGGGLGSGTHFGGSGRSHGGGGRSF